MERVKGIRRIDYRLPLLDGCMIWDSVNIVYEWRSRSISLEYPPVKSTAKVQK